MINHACPDTSALPAAPCCDGGELVLVGTAPQVGPFPELRTFRCRRCGHVQTIETSLAVMTKR